MDAYIAVGIFLFVIIFFFSFLAIRQASVDVDEQARKVSNNLMSNPVLSDREISQADIEYISNLTCDQLKELLDSQLDLCIYFEDEEGNVVSFLDNAKYGLGCKGLEISGVDCGEDIFWSNYLAISPFILRNNEGEYTASFTNYGDLILAGNCSIEADCNKALDDAFIVQSESGQTVAYIDSYGNLCAEAGSCLGHSTDCSSPADSSFIVMDWKEDIVSYISGAGELCVAGDLLQEGRP